MNVRKALHSILDGTTHAGRAVTPFLRLPLDFEDVAAGGAAVLVYTTGGTVGYVDRVDYATVEVYASLADGEAVAESIRDLLAGDPALVGAQGKRHDTPEGYIDGIRCEVAPHDVPFASDRTGLVRAVYYVTTRPLSRSPKFTPAPP